MLHFRDSKVGQILASLFKKNDKKLLVNYVLEIN